MDYSESQSTVKLSHPFILRTIWVSTQFPTSFTLFRAFLPWEEKHPGMEGILGKKTTQTIQLLPPKKPKECAVKNWRGKGECCTSDVGKHMHLPCTGVAFLAMIYLHRFPIFFCHFSPPPDPYFKSTHILEAFPHMTRICCFFTHSRKVPQLKSVLKQEVRDYKLFRRLKASFNHSSQCVLYFGLEAKRWEISPFYASHFLPVTAIIWQLKIILTNLQFFYD